MPEPTAICDVLCFAIWMIAHSYALLLVFAFLIATSRGMLPVIITSVMVEVALTGYLQTLCRFVLLWIYPPLLPKLSLSLAATSR